MADYRDNQQKAEFLKTISQTQVWLNTYFSRDDLRPEIQTFISSLRAYLYRCHKWVESEAASENRIVAKRQKIKRACFALWDKSQRR